MWIRLTNDKCFLTGPRTAEELTWLRGFLTFGDPNAGKDPHAKEQISLYNVFDDSFPAGMLDLVKRELKASGLPHKIEVADTRTRPCARVPLAEVAEHIAGHGCTLRKHQVDALNAAMMVPRGIVQLPTGTGKTTLAVAMILSLPVRWLFVVDSAHLVEDAAKRYRELTGRECGMIKAGVFKTGDVTFATFQSIFPNMHLSAMQAYLRSVQAVLVDEAHVSAADTFFGVLGNLPSAYFRYGLSATPLSRGDRKSILAVARLGSVVFRMTPGEAVAAGLLAEPRTTMLEVSQKGSYGEHQSVFRSKYIVRSRRRNAAVLDAVERCAKPALVFFHEEEHGHILTKLIREELGISCMMVWGKKSIMERKNAIAALERRDVEVIVCSSVFTKGVDIPFLCGGVHAAGGKSVINTLQRIGRGLRLSEGKDFYDWYDIADTGNRQLAERAREREATYQQAGYKTKRVVSIKAQAYPDMDAKKGKERLTSASQVKWSTGGDLLED